MRSTPKKKNCVPRMRKRFMRRGLRFGGAHEVGEAWGGEEESKNGGGEVKEKGGGGGGTGEKGPGQF